jgi:hypothetical protein
MTRALSHASQQNYHLIPNTNFSFLFLFLISKFITCVYRWFHFTNEIPIILIESQHMYWILDVEGVVHSI